MNIICKVCLIHACELFPVVEHEQVMIICVKLAVQVACLREHFSTVPYLKRRGEAVEFCPVVSGDDK